MLQLFQFEFERGCISIEPKMEIKFRSRTLLLSKLQVLLELSPGCINNALLGLGEIIKMNHSPRAIVTKEQDC